MTIHCLRRDAVLMTEFLNPRQASLGSEDHVIIGIPLLYVYDE